MASNLVASYIRPTVFKREKGGHDELRRACLSRHPEPCRRETLQPVFLFLSVLVAQKERFKTT